MIYTYRILLNDQIYDDEVGMVWGWHSWDEKCIGIFLGKCEWRGWLRRPYISGHIILNDS